MSFDYRNRLVSLLRYQNKIYRTYKSVNKTGVPKTFNLNTNPNYIDLVVYYNSVIAPDRKELLYDTIPPSNENIYDTGKWLRDYDFIEQREQIARALDKTELLFNNNNGAKVIDYFNQSLEIYNKCFRFLVNFNTIPYMGTAYNYTVTETTTRYNEDGSVSSERVIVNDYVSFSAFLDTRHLIEVRTGEFGNYIKTRGKREVVVNLIKVDDIYPNEFSGGDLFFMDECKHVFSKRSTFPEDEAQVVYQDRFYTGNFVNGEMAGFTVETPPQPAYSGEGGYSISYNEQSILFSTRELTWEDLINYDPKPTSWL